MEDERLQTDQRVCLVGGGHVCPEVLAKVLKYAPVLVAADGGAEAVLAAGHVPDRVIGDLDSVNRETLARLESDQIVHVTEQETTDFEKCLARIQAPGVIGVGFTGGRLDHTLAAMSTLAREVGPPTILVDREDVVFSVGRTTVLELCAGTRVSLFPMCRVSGRSEGLRWPIDSLALAPMIRIGTSNEALGLVTLEMDQLGLLALLPAAKLEAAMLARFG